MKGTPVYDMQVIVALFGVFTMFFVAQAWAVRTTRYLVREHLKSAVVGLGFTLGGMTVTAQVLAPDLQKELLQSVSIDPPQPDAENVWAQVIQYCTEHDSREALHRIHQHYEARAKELNNTEKMSLLDPPSVCPPGAHYIEDAISGSVLESIVSVVPKKPMKHIGPRAVIDYGFSYDPKLEHISPTTPIPPVFQTLFGVAHTKALQIDSSFAYPNEVSVNFHPVKPEPSGIGYHTDKARLGSWVGIFPGAPPVIFDMHKHKTPLESFPDWSFFLWPGSLLSLTGESRHRWSHAVAARNHDLHDGVKYPRDARWSIFVRSVDLPFPEHPIPSP